MNGEPLALTPTEFYFLTYLVEHQDRAVSRDELLKNLWQYNWQADTRAADDLVKRLRRKRRGTDLQGTGKLSDQRSALRKIRSDDPDSARKKEDRDFCGG